MFKFTLFLVPIYVIAIAFVMALAIDIPAATLAPIPPTSDLITNQRHDDTAGVSSRRSPFSAMSCMMSGNWIVNLAGQSCHNPTGFCGGLQLYSQLHF
jgi:hypothetical protein